MTARLTMKSIKKILEEHQPPSFDAYGRNALIVPKGFIGAGNESSLIMPDNAAEEEKWAGLHGCEYKGVLWNTHVFEGNLIPSNRGSSL